MGQIQFLGSIVFIIIFSLAIINYSITFADENNANISLANESEFTNLKLNIESDTNQFSTEDVNTSSSSFFQTNIESGDETTNTGGTFKILFKAPIESIKAITSSVNKYIFGGGNNENNNFSFIMTLFVSFLIILSILYIWKTWKGGTPD